MKNILILGAGLVSRPGVKYLLGNSNLNIIVADIFPEKAEALIEGSTNGKAVALDINDTEKLDVMISENDIIVSLLPWTLHMKVADLCIKNNKNMVTTSYVSDGMKILDPLIREKGLLFINEVGVDPGIDHMSAKKIIDEVEKEGGKILEFYSYTGGLPAPENNDNPFGYKFSWSPRGVLLASRNSAKFLENGIVVDIPGEELFLNCREDMVDELGDFEVYPNRDSIIYKELYGLDDVTTLIRGTYRYPGWCRTLKLMIDLGLFSDIPTKGISRVPYSEAMSKLEGISDKEDLKKQISERYKILLDSEELERLEWLGLFGDELTPDHDNFFEILSDLMEKKLYYEDSEKDMVLMKHTFTILNKDGSKEKVTSTLIDYGIPGGDSSMSRTVSLPLAISVKMMAEGKFDLTGVQIPVISDLYLPILAELENLGIKMAEKRTSL